MDSKYFNQKLIYILLQVGIMSLLFLWPLMSHHENVQVSHQLLKNAIPTVLILILFYFNYFVLIDSYYLKKKPVFFFINALSIIVLFFAAFYFKGLIRSLGIIKPYRNHLSPQIHHIQLLLSLVLTVGMSVALRISVYWKEKELEVEKIKQVQLFSEIKSLHHQVQPHFLFNTLNNIYSLIDNSPENAKDSIHSLSNMMRYLIHGTNAELVSLSKEIAFIERYIELMQLRVSADLVFEKNIPNVVQSVEIAPLLLITFVENAFKHGIDAIEHSFIKINITVHNNLIDYTVINSFFPDSTEITDSGIGLENLKKRLELLYPGKFKLSKTFNNKEYIARLILDFK